MRDVCTQRLGVGFDPWQDGAGRLILSKRADGKLAVMVDGVGMSLPRQVGKTYLIGALVFALCILFPGLLVIWSAHHGKTHGETFLAMQAFAARPRVKPWVKAVYVGSGDEAVVFHNGSRILFGARERGFGRGIPGVDIIVSDEGQILSDKALDDQLATMNTSQLGLALYIGTPPRPTDPSEVFTTMRTQAWAGNLRDGAWIELGAEPGVDPNDRKVWARVNPSFPHRTPPESILRLQRKLKPDSFLREGLGVWDEEAVDGLTLAAWSAQPDGPRVLGIDVAPHHASASIVAVGSGVLSLVEKRPGSAWLLPRLLELAGEKHVSDIAVDPTGNAPVGSLMPKLEESVLPLRVLTATESGRACAAILKAVAEKSFHHRGDEEFEAAVIGAKLVERGDGHKWSRKHSAVDISPLVAATNALWVAEGSDYDLLQSIG